MPRAPLINPKKETYNKSNKYLKDREESTPVYEKQEFVPPETLTEKELEVWERLVNIFRDTVNCRMSDADIDIMKLYCRAMVATDEADEELKKDPRAYVIIPLGKDINGNVKTTAKPNPNIKKRLDNAALCLKLLDQMGLSPLARARAGIKTANAKADIDIFKELMNRTDD